MIKPGRLEPTWVPAVLTRGDVSALKVGLAVLAAFRALDYASGTLIDVPLEIEKAMPMWAWATACMAIALAIFTGTAARRHLLVWVGHAIGVTVYASLAVGGFMDVMSTWPPATELVSRGINASVWGVMCLVFAVVPTLGAWALWYFPHRNPCWSAVAIAIALALFMSIVVQVPFDGIRRVGPVALIAWLHLLMAARSGPRPIKPDDIVPNDVVMSSGAR